MNEKELMQKLKEVEKDADFMKMLFEQDSPEKIQGAFATKGIELTLDEVKTLVVNVMNSVEKKDGEIDEAALDAVSGGFAISAMIGLVCAALMAAGGAAIGWRLAKGKC